MSHSDIQPLSVEELMGLIYGEEQLSPERQKHLDQCALCQQELKTYEQLHGRLSTRLYRALCPDSVELHYYCLDTLPNEKRTAIASHLLDCPRCTDEVAEIRRQQASFDPFPEPGASPLMTVRRLIATLITPQLQPATRNQAPVDSWPRQYHAGTIDISLHLSQNPGGEIMLVGILTGVPSKDSVDTFEGVTIELHAAPKSAAAAAPESAEFTQPLLTTEVDDMGSIVLESIPPGEYILLIRLPDEEVLIEGINIQSVR